MVKNFFLKIIKSIVPSSSRWLPRCYYGLKYLNLKALPAHARILDAGCGQGKMLLQFHRTDVDIVGVDSCDKTITRAGQNVNQLAKNKKINLVTASLVKLPFPDNYFDAIISLDVIEFIEDDASAFKELARVLNPVGKLIVTVLHSNLELEDGNLSFEQRFLRRVTPNFFLTKGQPYNGKNWLNADAFDKFKQDGRCRNYSIEDIEKKISGKLKIVRSQYMIKRFFRLAMDITYSLKGTTCLRPFIFPMALAFDAIFCKRKSGYAIILEFQKMT